MSNFSFIVFVFTSTSRLTRCALVTGVQTCALPISPMETRACIADYDTGTDSFTFYVSSQGAHDMRDTLAGAIFGVPPERFTVRTGDVGGGFGMKLFMYPEYVETVYAERKFGRPARWMAERDRKSVGSGKCVTVRVDLGGSRNIKKKTQIHKDEK